MKCISNYSKKQEQHNFNCITIDLPDKVVPLKKTSYLFQGEIIPNKVIKEKNVFEITYLDEMFHLSGFMVSVENNRVLNVIIFGYHPNCDSNTGIYCLPDFKQGVEFTEEYLSRLITNIKTYYLDSCYLMPTNKQLKYRKIQSMYIQINSK